MTKMQVWYTDAQTIEEMCKEYIHNYSIDELILHVPTFANAVESQRKEIVEEAYNEGFVDGKDSRDSSSLEDKVEDLETKVYELKDMLIWALGDDTGTSSKAILKTYLGHEVENAGTSYPRDPSDLGRCLRLIEEIPVLHIGLQKLAGKHSQWAKLCANWGHLKETMEEEAGIDWSKGTNAPKTYELMREILKDD